MNYKEIQETIERCITSLQDDLELLHALAANDPVIEQVEKDIKCLKQASEVVWIYNNLEK